MTVLGFFADSYYTLPVMMICDTAAVLVSYQRKSKFKELKYFHLYPIASLTQVIFSLVVVGCLDGNMESKYMYVSVEVFLFLEVLLIYNFFSNVIRLNSHKLILKVFFIAFLIYSIGVLVFTGTIFNSGKIITAETCVVILSVCLYFIELFKLPPTLHIIEQPAFWINIGILFLFSCTLPSVVLMFLVDTYILSDSYFYFINFLGYSVLFLLMIRGYLCKEKEQIPNDSTYAFY